LDQVSRIDPGEQMGEREGTERLCDEVSCDFPGCV
jgi:hypothetical protein